MKYKIYRSDNLTAIQLQEELEKERTKTEEDFEKTRKRTKRDQISNQRTERLCERNPFSPQPNQIKHSSKSIRNNRQLKQTHHRGFQRPVSLFIDRLFPTKK